MNAVMSHPKAKDYRHELRKLFHGPILKDIADQVKVRQEDGSLARYPAWIWKEYLRARFNAGVIVHDNVPHPQEMTFDEEDKPQ